MEMKTRANRYSIRRDVEYRLRGPRGNTWGSGRTVNISRRGVLFETEPDLRIGSRIDLVIDMGTLIDGNPRVKLHAQGITVRSKNGKVAVAIRKHRLSEGEEGLTPPAPAIASESSSPRRTPASQT